MGRLHSLGITFAAGIAIGVVESCLAAWPQVGGLRSMTPFLVAIGVLLWLGRGRVVTVGTSGPIR